MDSYPFPGPDPKFEPCERPDAIIARLQKGTPVDISEATEFLDWLAYATRVQLNKVVSRSMGEDNAILKHPLTGKCELAQAIEGYGLEDLKIPHHYFDVDRIYNDLFNRDASFKHVGVSIEILTTHGNKLFLVDTTFRMFCDLDHVKHWDSECPGSILAKQEHGPGLMDQLLYDGWIELSPLMAQLYLRAFSRPSWSFCPQPEQAIQYFRSPPAGFDKCDKPRSLVANYNLCNP